jgi:biopolymer transport protein ExbB
MELTYVFEESILLLGSLGTIRPEPGDFYLEDGSRVEGEIVHVGRIASYGVSVEQAGTLAPVGGGNLQLVETDTAETARKLAAGEKVEQLPLFIYESADKPVVTSSDKTFADTIEGGGIIGIVILVLGGVALILVITRAVMLAGSSKKNDEQVEEIARLVEQKNYDQAILTSGKLGGALGRVLHSTVTGLKTDPEKVEDAVSESVLNEQPRLERFRSAISVFAAVAPLLGLLGTVTGMIATFDIITVFGTGDPKLLSGGISEALITTELGLTVAIPTLLIGNLLSSWADRITSGLEVNALRVVNIASGFESSKAKA